MQRIQLPKFPEILVVLAISTLGVIGRAQQAPPSTAPSILDRLNAMMSGGKSAWTPEQLATMERLRDARMNDPYALDELAPSDGQHWAAAERIAAGGTGGGLRRGPDAGAGG